MAEDFEQFEREVEQLLRWHERILELAKGDEKEYLSAVARLVLDLANVVKAYCGRGGTQQGRWCS